VTLRIKIQLNIENSIWFKQIIEWTNKLLYEQINDNITDMLGT
jgi:hypothetical protein